MERVKAVIVATFQSNKSFGQDLKVIYLLYKNIYEMFKGLIPSSALGTGDPGAQHCCLLNNWLLRETRMPLFPTDTRYSEQKQKPGTILSILLSPELSFPIFIFL